MTTKKTDTEVNTMELWDRVSKTNPKNTKRVKLGREFTAIDPHSQIMEATRMFGPAGDKWGWEVLRVEYLPTDEVAVLIRLKHGDPELEGYHVEQWGQCGLFIDRGKTRPDEDCMKKATTDGITKCLSYLGFNADVFLGKFDDNKYVEKMAAEFDAKDKAEARETDPTLKNAKIKADQIIKNLETADSAEAVNRIADSARATVIEIAKVDRALAQSVATAKAKALAQFPDTDAGEKDAA
jgi:hypothetical protein